MAVTPNMSLVAWTLSGDPYSHSELAANFTAIDAHNHTLGQGVQIPTAGIADAAITQEKLDPAVTAIPGQFATGSIQSDAILDGTIVGADMAAGTVGTTQLTNLGVTTGKLADGAVTTAKVLDGSLLGDDLAVAEATRLGLSSSGVVRRGKCIIPGTESRTTTSYQLMPTPDQVTSLVLPTDGLIVVLYHAEWQQTNADKGRAAIFLNSNQLKVPDAPGGFYGVTSAYIPTENDWNPLSSFPLGLASGNDNIDISGITTTGVAVGLSNNNSKFTTDAGNQTIAHPGGPCYIWAAAGTYNVSVQYRVQGGGGDTVFARNRKLWAWTIGF